MMKLLLNNPPTDARCGDFIQPRSFNKIGKTAVWAADNDAFKNFDTTRFLLMIAAIAEAPCKPKFVVAPDIPFNFEQSFGLLRFWSGRIRARGIPVAFAYQGIGHPRRRGHLDFDIPSRYLLHPDFPWDLFDALFIAGTTAFKFCELTRRAVTAARQRGKWVHMGRVNSNKRLHYARMIGCDSCDGSGMARYRRRVLVPMLRELNQGVMTLT